MTGALPVPRDFTPVAPVTVAIACDADARRSLIPVRRIAVSLRVTPSGQVVHAAEAPHTPRPSAWAAGVLECAECGHDWPCRTWRDLTLALVKGMQS